MNRGSRLTVGLARVRFCSFNEAPIHESGKSVPESHGREDGHALQ